MKTFCIGIVLAGMLVSGSRDCFGQTFSEVSIGPLQGTFEGQMVWLDVDHDLDYDLIICGNLSTKLFKNTGGVFSESVDHNLPGLSHPAIAMADFNHDGFVDLVLTGNTSDDTNPVPMGNTFINDGTGIFTASSTANLLPLFFGSVDCSDFDLDGDVDILMTGYNANSVSQSVIYSNNGDGSFSPLSSALLPGVFHGTGMWGDFDNDGDPDILMSGDNHTDNNPNKPLTKIFRNKGDRTFEEVATTITPIHGKSSWADVNEDGRLDLFTSGYASDGGYYTFLYLNQGGDSFVKSTGLPFEGTSFIDFRWADFDNDGDLDLLTSSAQGSEVSIYVNTAGVFALLSGTNFNHAE
ncbi:MAG TPA: VCBS repeat-containing protein, partial [Cyclobacteriaceae bacterium]|nr:VCBS repeat-containing protein [Cyclobacteriaceae bacterium]